jgi:catalase
VKFHLKTEQGIQNLSSREAVELAGTNPDHATQDLFEAISREDYPRWRLSVQIMPEQAAASYHLNPFDLTKVWPHRDYPLIPVGELELNRNPENYFAEIEQASFAPANVVPGISFSPAQARRQLRVAAGESAQVSRQSLPQRRRDALRRKRRLLGQLRTE